jgi:hypothetical protein
MLGFNDAFFIIAVMLLSALLLVLLMQSPEAEKDSDASGH